ncbi:NAD(P)/FAD-dependent oxidoreductase [Pseudocolwellia agarivorans]|uniref:NAD(P)/FAD-dependent oxidoreductase n=1 Tax=Pseudocolwellia agarivorans TaxID=1911682 RepID=UPI000987112C|nr:FAD-dependent oxidoreductase [Pseudocolwellia agarivorans]
MTTMMNPKEEVHWRTTATPGPECSSLKTNLTVDTVIVGGGLTGCRTALGLAESGMSVALLDAQCIGWGASGRSGGQCNPIWRETPEQLIKRFGEAQAERLIKTTITSADDLFADIAKYNIDCDAVQAGWVQAAHNRSARRSLEKLAEGWSAAGAKIERLEGDAVKKATGSPAYDFALRYKVGGNVQPLSLTHGYAINAQTKGAQLFSDSPVTSIERLGSKWRVTSPSGSVTAEKVVLTTNAYSTNLWPGLKQTFLPMVSIAIATEPLPKELQAVILPGKVTISDSRLAIYFSRYDRDGRLIFGCVGSTDTVGTLGGHQRLREGLRTVFPQLKNIAIERTWSGRIAVTPEMMPHLHQPEPGIIAGLGFSGRGIAMTSVMGRTITDKILGVPDDELAFPVSPIKKIPMHSLMNATLPLGAPLMSIRDKLSTIIDI